MLQTGQVLQERYRVERQIGQGGMGSVYLATDERFNSTVAIKETLIADDNFRKALMREARLLNSLKHVALPKVSDHFVEDNGQYIVMEYISGEDLHEMMERSAKAFPMSDIRQWTEQLLDALEYLHGQENPIIHRDIKPQNLKLTPQGQVILLDFGLAKGNPTDANHKTAANSIFGYSRHYASLEQIQGTGTDPRSDIYSLAATLYHLATGKAPADALTRVMNVMNEDEDTLLPANKIHEQVDEEFAAALSQCMSLNANLRPQTARETYELIFEHKKPVREQETKAQDSPAAFSAFSTQNTRIIPDADSAEPSELRTKVMDPRAPDDSVVTRLATPETEFGDRGGTIGGGGVTQSTFSRSRVLAAVGALALLLVGSVIAVVYYGSFTTAEQPAGSALSNSDTEAAVPLEDGGADVSGEASSEAEVAVSGAEDAPETSSPKPQTASGTGRAPTAPAPETGAVIYGPSEKDLEELRRLEKELGTEFEFKMKDGKIYSEDLVIDDKGVMIRPIRPGQRGVRLPTTREELRRMTPEQRKKLRDAMEMRRLAERNIPKVDPPKPPKTPSPLPSP
ncbi:MAG: serine/threonine protein kinase [Acidobacteria bacterium]|nr:MAG: serine/threonine protein kinase [Acidobacteriota bacterium]REK02328.1 MAG: serine/threonine protein kinase [Acidobacteriota bacterium]REK13869.1 MAG: serine/threonine protein kinase [Acidobacteriota bacterium]REK41864.1 MAG: serine/threonine protein kinase [Acidobacteriota bacterium]